MLPNYPASRVAFYALPSAADLFPLKWKKEDEWLGLYRVDWSLEVSLWEIVKFRFQTDHGRRTKYRALCSRVSWQRSTQDAWLHLNGVLTELSFPAPTQWVKWSSVRPAALWVRPLVQRLWVGFCKSILYFGLDNRAVSSPQENRAFRWTNDDA